MVSRRFFSFFFRKRCWDANETEVVEKEMRSALESCIVNKERTDQQFPAELEEQWEISGALKGFIQVIVIKCVLYFFFLCIGEEEEDLAVFGLTCYFTEWMCACASVHFDQP